MATREYPEQYFSGAEFQRLEEVPSWVPILLGIALIGAFAVAFYAIHKCK